MIKINFPPPAFKIKTEHEKELIFDEIRKQWVRLSPEEWVRQNFIQYLIRQKSYPAALIAIEKELQLGELKKRFDILVYNSHHQPVMIIECKRMEEALDEKTLDQALRYNMAIPVRYIIITNGSYCFGFERQDKSPLQLTEIPDWVSIR
ncbi:MAG: type I restriction enzyme HsdR N-terminal domain-containing protein [Chitinophagaceae bacterium]|nr:type I restriction enzyme HsdR N-terminal domain-containing protein [Chitinophagaceae bacterium]